MARPRYGPQARSALFQALTGRAGADVSGAPTADLRGMLLAAFGPSPRDPTRPNTALAAQRLGITQRTVQRYLAAEGRERIGRPRPDILRRISTAARQAASTQRGRAAAVRDVRDSGLPRWGMSLTIRGLQGPDPDYQRRRTVTMNLDPDHAGAFIDAYVAHGENGALGYLADNAEHVYQIESWHFADVTDVDLGGPYGAD